MSRSISGYFFPGIWFGTLASVLNPNHWDDIVADGNIPEFARITIHREGLVWFDFTDTKFNSILTPGADPEKEVMLLAERALFMTAHSTCIAKAYLERANSIWVGGTVVTSSRQIVAGGGVEPTAADPMLYRYCIERWHFKKRIPFWGTYGGADTTLFPLSEDDAKRSLELFAELVKSRDTVEALNLIIRAETYLQDHDFIQSLVQAWTAIELSLDRLWWKVIDKTIPAGVEGNSLRRKRLDDNRSYTASVRAEMLNFMGAFNDELYGRLASLRKTRNDFLHEGSTIGPTAAMLSKPRRCKVACNPPRKSWTDERRSLRLRRN